MIHAYADDGARAGPRLPRRDRGAPPGPARRAVGQPLTVRPGSWAAMPIEFAERIRRIPVYPAADGYALAATSRCSPPTRRRIRRCRRSQRRSRAALGGAQPLSGPDELALRAALSDRYGVPVAPDRDRQRLVRHPARRRRGAARAGRRARLRVAELQRLPAPRRRVGRARDRGAGRRRRTATTSTRCAAEITAATRLVIVCNPNNPTSTALPLEEIAAFVARGPAPRRRDPRRGLLRVQPAPGPRRVARPARRATRTSSCCARSRRSTGSCGLRVGFALCGSEDFRTAVDQVRQPFFCNVAAQAAAIEALRTRTRSPAASSATSPSGSTLEDGLRAARDRARGVAGQLRLVRPARATPTASATRSCAALAERGVLVRAGDVARAARARCASRSGPARGEKFLAALGELL